MTDEKILVEIQPFIDACDKMIASKFIMIDKRISDVLKSIASCKPVFNLVKDCMVNFNFEKEWGLATAKMGYIVPPDDSRMFVAFVFSLLNSIDSKKLSASSVLSMYYSKIDAGDGPYDQFCKAIIERFKTTIQQLLVKKKDSAPAKKQEKIQSVNREVLSRLAFLAKDLKDYVQGLKKLKKSKITKGELVEIISGLLNAIENANVVQIKPFVLAIKAGYGKDKEIERRLIEINDIVYRTLLDA